MRKQSNAVSRAAARTAIAAKMLPSVLERWLHRARPSTPVPWSCTSQFQIGYGTSRDGSPLSADCKTGYQQRTIRTQAGHLQANSEDMPRQDIQRAVRSPHCVALEMPLTGIAYECNIPRFKVRCRRQACVRPGHGLFKCSTLRQGTRYAVLPAGLTGTKINLKESTSLRKHRIQIMAAP
jgi:hypothetical protein